MIRTSHHTLDDLVFPVVFLDLQQVVAEVQDVEASLLTQQSDDHTAGPVEPVSETLSGEQTNGERESDHQEKI